jgi:mannose-1-phosphate guanylyltransferase
VVSSDLPPRDESGSLIGAGCITSGARIGPQAVLGRHCSVGPGAQIDRAVLHDGARIAADCYVRESIVGAGARIGERARVEPNAVVGGGAVVAADSIVEAGARLAPGEPVS